MANKVRKLSTGEIAIFCKGCGNYHAMNERWSYNGNPESPTLVPSILVKLPDGGICHSYIINGKQQYLPDTTHEYSGKTIYLEDEED